MIKDSCGIISLLKFFETRWLIKVKCMSDISKKISNNKNHIRCKKCNKLLAKCLSPGHFEIKCLRCGLVETVLRENT